MTTIGICGDDCAYCPRYLATRSGKGEELEKVKALWLRLGLQRSRFACAARDLVCNGCVPENDCAYLELRTCVQSKGVENCGVCDTYPCELVNAAFERSDLLCARAESVCEPEEMELLRKAFFSKRRNLEKKRQRGSGCS
jgi:hypothetical protein